MNKEREKENEYSHLELEESIYEFLQSCYRTGNTDLEDNINYFLKENNHMNLDEEEVRNIFIELEEESN
jgi:hypothetical protein